MICVPLVLGYEMYNASGESLKERWQYVLKERLPEQTLKALAKIEEEELSENGNSAEIKPALDSKTDFIN